MGTLKNAMDASPSRRSTMPSCSMMILEAVLKNSAVTGATFSIPSSCVSRVYSRQSANSTVTSERRPVSQWDFHLLQRLGLVSLRRTPRSHHISPMSPVKGTPSARHLGDNGETLNINYSSVSPHLHGM